MVIAGETVRDGEESVTGSKNTALPGWGRVLRRPDRAFVSSGRGKLGCITELRHGLPARITQVAEYVAPIRKCWTIRPIHGGMQEGFLLLLSLPDRTAVIHFSEDFEDVIDQEEDTVPYDLSSRTLATQDSNDMIVQVTTSFVITVASSNV